VAAVRPRGNRNSLSAQCGVDLGKILITRKRSVSNVRFYWRMREPFGWSRCGNVWPMIPKACD